MRGATPGRAVVAGRGLRQVLGAGAEGGPSQRVPAGFGTFEPDSPEGQAEQWLRG